MGVVIVVRDLIIIVAIILFLHIKVEHVLSIMFGYSDTKRNMSYES